MQRRPQHLVEQRGRRAEEQRVLHRGLEHVGVEALDRVQDLLDRQLVGVDLEVGELLAAALTRQHHLRRLRRGDAAVAQLPHPLDQLDVLVGVEAVRRGRPPRRRDPVAPLPRAQGRRRNPGHLRHGLDAITTVVSHG
jgi:hypothetical protein